MNLKWYYLRWSHFDHPFEVFYRFKQFLRNRLIDPVFLNAFDKPGGEKLIVNKSLFLYASKNHQIKANNVPDYQFYNINLNLNKKIKWRFDYKNRITSPIKLSTKIAKNDFQEVGELKIALEPSRFVFLPSYTFYYLQLNKERRNQVYSPIQHIIDWKNENPFLRTFNWSDGIEVGIRSINLTFSILLIKDIDKTLFEKNQSLFLELIKKHDYFLRNHLSLYSSANNHLIAELAGIITLNCAFNINKKSTVSKYVKLLTKFTPQQFFKDGFSTEQSTHYFKDVLSLYSVVVAMIKRFNFDVDIDVINKQLIHAKPFLEDLRIEKGLFFDMGDNDDSLIVGNIFDQSFSEYESVRNDLLIISNANTNINIDFRNYLLWGGLNKDYLEKQNNEPEKQKRYHFYDYSKYLFYHNLKTHLLIDYSNLGYKFLGAHGHSDLMSFQLAVKNIPLFIDPGTYQYHDKFIKERNFFRGISAHNTLSIDNNNHSAITSNMMWNRITSPQNVDYKKKPEGFLISGEFNFPKNKKHKRTYKLNEFESELHIFDELKSMKESTFHLFFQINPDCKIVKSETQNQFEIISSQGTSLTTLFIEGSELDVSIKSGSLEPYVGWYSDKYDNISKGKTIVVEGKFKSEKLIKTKIKII